MTFVSTHAVLERPKEISGLRHYNTHFGDLAIVECAPWLYSALAQLWEIEQNGREIKGLGDFRIAANTGIRVRRMLSKVGDIKNLPVPALNVFSGGGVTLTWEAGGREVKYSFWPEEVLSYWQEHNGETVQGDELPDDRFGPRAPLEWLLRP